MPAGAILRDPAAVFAAAAETLALRESGQLPAMQSIPPRPDTSALPKRLDLVSGEVLSVSRSGALVALDGVPPAACVGVLRRTHVSGAYVGSAEEVLGRPGARVSAVVAGAAAAGGPAIGCVPPASGVPYTGAQVAYAAMRERGGKRPYGSLKVGSVVTAAITATSPRGPIKARVAEAPGRAAVLRLGAQEGPAAQQQQQPAEGTEASPAAPASAAPYSPGDLVRCRVVSLDGRGVATLEPYDGPDSTQLPLPAEIKVGALLRGTVVNVKSFGAFVDVGAGSPALLHRERVTAEAPGQGQGQPGGISGGEMLRLFRVGEELPVLVVEVEEAQRRMVLSTAELEPSPGDMIRNREAVVAQAEAMAERWRAARGQAGAQAAQ
ncbi:hypothetical protein GPECTOR_141g690 [Gonium pectorale]|uniref:S1 motif domain-containing protein n=1 Tax=Gonium pectorale TaxID=33097 RepID=A0A150FXZ8_GONPE|nr:hypothetical protein GPECTOR_141g690 [Gonium pectorale]|eukprot:KXZ42492.1 hypothetical protein GPECTOR_141g690 [Gonium pectorale]